MKISLEIDNSSFSWVYVGMSWAVSIGRQSDERPPCLLSSSHGLLVLQPKGYAFLALNA